VLYCDATTATPQTAEKYIPMIEDDDVQIGALLAVNKLKAAFLIAAKPEASAKVPTKRMVRAGGYVDGRTDR